MAVFRLPLPTIIPTGSGGGISPTAITSTQSSIQLDANGINGTIIAKTNDKEAFFIDNNQRTRFGAVYNSNHRVSISDPVGLCLEFTYDKSDTIKTSMAINSSGDLNINTYSNILRLPSMVRIDGHNGSNSGLVLGNVLVTSSAEQLNYNNVQKGIAQSGKSLVASDTRDIENINNLTANNLYGIIQTGSQPFLNSVNSINIANHGQGNQGLSLGGVLVLATANELNYNRVNAGTASANRSMVVDSNRSITGIVNLLANNLGGTLLTSAQPNITSLGTIGNLNTTGSLGVNKVGATYALDINHNSGSCLRMYYNHASSGNLFSTLDVNSLGSLVINTSGASIIISNGKTLSFSSGGNIEGVSTIIANNIMGSITTNNQPNITSIGTLNSLNVSGNVAIGTQLAFRRLEVNDVNGNCLRLSNNAPVGNATNFVDLLVGSNGSLSILPSGGRINIGSNTTLSFINNNGVINGLNSITATTINGVLSSGPQPNITSLGALSSLHVTGDISGINNIFSNRVYGQIMDSSQPNITSLGNLTNLVVTGSLTGLTSLTSSDIYGTIRTSAQPNITSIGNLSSLIVRGTITGVTSLLANNITGTLQTNNQPNITSIGTLSSLNVSGDAIFSADLTADKLYGTIFTSSQPNITSIGSLSSLVVNGTLSGVTTLTATTYIGTIATASQPNITSIGTLSSLVVNGTISGITSLTATNLSGTITTTNQPNITSIGILNNLKTSGLTGINTTNPTKRLEVNDVTGECLRLSNNAPNGNSTNYVDFHVNNFGSLSILPTGPSVFIKENRNLVLDDGDIYGVHEITADIINGTLETSVQPNINVVGTLSSLLVSGSVGINCTIPSRKLEIHDEDGDCLRLVYKSNVNEFCDFNVTSNGGLFITTSGNEINIEDDTTIYATRGIINGLSNISATSLGGTLSTAAQPNITSVGILQGLGIQGRIGINVSNPNHALDINDINGTCLIMRYNNNPALFTSMTVNSSGELTINPTGNSIILSADTDLKFSGNSSIIGIDSITSNTLYGTLYTSSQPYINSLGTLNSLRVSGNVGINTTNPSSQLEINSINGSCLKLSNNAPSGNASNACELNVSNTGELTLIPTGNSVRLATDKNLVLSGSSRITCPQAIFGNTNRSTMPLEVGVVPFNMTASYAFNNNFNAHGIVSAGSTAVFNYSIRTDGRILCTGSVDVTSDIRLKKNIKELDEEYCKKFVMNTDPVSFNWRTGDTTKAFGYIAQDLLKSGFGDLVNVAEEEGIEEYVDENGFISPKNVKFTISYDNIIPILAQNQKKIMEENEFLKRELEELKKLIKSNIDNNNKE